MTPPEQPQKEENNAGQITQTSVHCDARETAALLRIQSVEQFSQAVVHVDLRVPFRNSLQVPSGNIAEVPSEPQLIPSPTVERRAVGQIVVISELIARHRPVRRRWIRDPRGEIVLDIVLFWESDLQARTSVISGLLESDKFAMIVLPH